MSDKELLKLLISTNGQMKSRVDWLATKVTRLEVILALVGLFLLPANGKAWMALF